jgi:chromosome segregation ATPase
MAFDYDKIKHNREGNETFWTAYSDLFSVLSAIFLLLYVVTSVHSGTFSIQKEVQYQVLAKEAEDLKDQIRIYNALRDETVEQSSEDEQKQYKMLMDKLTLLQEETNEEKNDLIAKSRELAQKEDALNKYQQMIRNIVNVNMLSKRQIKQRDFLIAKKDFDITEKDSEIRDLNADITKKEKVIDDNNRQIASIQNRLTDQIKRVQAAQKSAKMTRAAAMKRIASLREQSQKQIQAIEGKNATIERDLETVRSNLALTQNTLVETEGKLQEVTERSAAEKQSLLGKIDEVKSQSEAERGRFMGKLKEMEGKSAAEKQALLAQLESTKSGYAQQMAQLKAEGEARMAAEKAAFDKALAGEKLSGAARAAREAEFRRKAEGEAQALKGALQGLGDKIGEAERQLAAAREKEGRFLASVDKLSKENMDLGDRLRKAKENAEAKKKLVSNIKDNFRKAGVSADIDEKTGDVYLSFGDDYFESGRADLKDSMQRRLEKFIPQYSKSLFSDPNTAKNIASVEIIGFASSTYKGKYVNPQSLDPKDREAVDYNLKLSFNRANSIFRHIFDKQKLQYEHQKDLLPLVKVVGRGYLPDGKQGNEIPKGMPEREFCKQFNCAKAQRVIIKFNLKE